MTMVEFAGQSARDSDNPTANTSRLINCYREPIGGRAGYLIRPVLGSQPFVDLNAVFLRAMYATGGDIYVACGGFTYRVSDGGVISVFGAVLDGETTISSNNGKLTVAANGEYYVWNPYKEVPPTGAFSDVGSVEFHNQRTIITERNGRRFSWSDPVDPTTFDALNFATAEARSDNILRAVLINGNVWLFKASSIEIWYDTGSGGADAYSRLAGGVIDTGLRSFGLVTRIDGGAFFVGDDGIAYITTGAGLQPVSTPAVETDIASGEPDRAFYYEDEGHKICVVVFKDRPAWCYDLSTGEWHRRAYGVTHEAWPVVDAVKLGKTWYSGNNVGTITKMARTSVDGGVPLLRRMVSSTLYAGARRFTLHEAEVFGRVGDFSLGGPVASVIGWGGSGLDMGSESYYLISQADAPTRAAQCWARFSRDGGRTWGPEKWKSMGALGDYESRAVWRSQGQFRQMTMELNCAEPQDIGFWSKARVRL